MTSAAAISRYLVRFLAAAVAVVAPGCGRDAAPQGPQGFPPAPVTLTVVQPADIEEATEYVGVLKSLRSTAIQSQVEGILTAIRVTSGDRVSAGEPLFEIDPEEQRASVSSLEADIAAKQTTLALARQELKRVSELHAAGLVSQQALDQADTAVSSAEAELASLTAKLQEEQVRLRYFSVRAPVAGVVGDVPVRVGARITPQTVLTTVDDNSTLELHVSVPVERARDLRLGLPLHLIGADGAPLAATTVSFVSPRVADQTQSVLVKGLLRSDDAGFRSDQQVRVRVVWSTSKGLKVPVLSVVRLNNQHFVFVAEEQEGRLTARQRPITVGPVVGDDYVVLDGLEPDERIVTSGVQRIGDGAPIAPQS